MNIDVVALGRSESRARECFSEYWDREGVPIYFS